MEANAQEQLVHQGNKAVYQVPTNEYQEFANIFMFLSGTMGSSTVVTVTHPQSDSLHLLSVGKKALEAQRKWKA